MRCADCAWWVKAESADIGFQKGDCHGAPPAPVVMQGRIAFGWPATDGDDWCGAFREKNAKPE